MFSSILLASERRMAPVVRTTPGAPSLGDQAELENPSQDRFRRTGSHRESNIDIMTGVFTVFGPLYLDRHPSIFCGFPHWHRPAPKRFRAR